MLTVHTDWRPKHCSNYLSWFALLVIRTAPRHSCTYPPPPQKVNCILNLGLNAIGYMRTSIHSNAEFQNQLKACNGLEDVTNLLKEYAKVFKEFCGNCLNLIKSIFCCLKLRAKSFKVCVAILNNLVDTFPQGIELWSVSKRVTVELWSSVTFYLQKLWSSFLF